MNNEGTIKGLPALYNRNLSNYFIHDNLGSYILSENELSSIIAHFLTHLTADFCKFYVSEPLPYPNQ